MSLKVYSADGREKQGIPPANIKAVGAFRAEANGALNPTHPAPLVFPVKAYDVNNWYDPATGRYTPKLAGYYRFMVCIGINATASAANQYNQIELMKNGVRATQHWTYFINGGLAYPTFSTFVLYLNGSTDYATVTRATNLPSSATFGTGDYTFFSGEYIGSEFGAAPAGDPLLYEPGDLKWSARITPRVGWLVCDGTAISRGTYAGLFAAIGTTYGVGDGSTTFNLPDYRDRIPVVVGTHSDHNAVTDNDGVAVGSGRKVKHRHGKGTLNVTASGDHIHNLDYSGARPAMATAQHFVAAGSSYWIANHVTPYYLSSTAGATHTHTSGNFAGEVGDTTGPLDSPAYHAMNCWIKT